MPPEWTPLFNVGAIGFVLGWFMLKAEPRLRGIEDAMDRQTRGNMLLILAFDDAPHSVKKQAQSMLEELEKK